MRLIDADVLDDVVSMLNEKGGGITRYEYKVMESVLFAFPTIDAVEVVRCRDCRWYDNRYGDVCHNPRYGDGWANYPPPYVNEDYWCKDGDGRKGGDDE